MFSNTPPVTKNLIIISALMLLGTYSIQHAFNIDLRDYLGLHFMLGSSFNPAQYISYMFMHGDPMHLLFNMFSLWMFGRVLEQVWGPKKFLTYFLLTGIGAGLLHSAVVYFDLAPIVSPITAFLNDPTFESFQANVPKTLYMPADYHYSLAQLNEVLQNWSANPNDGLLRSKMVEMMTQYRDSVYSSPRVVGASGSVYGILLAFGMMFPNIKLMLLFPPIPIKAKYLVIVFGLFEFFSGVANNPGDNIAHFAHLGGMLFGFIILKFVWKQKRLQ